MSKKLKKNVPVLRFSEFEGNWESKKLKNITSKIGSGATPIGGDTNYKKMGISLFRSLNVYDGFFKPENLAFIDENQAQKLNNVEVKKGDILLNITGASIARCCIAPVELLPARVNQHVMIIRPDPRSVKTEFLALVLICIPYKKKLFQLGGKGGSTREALTKDHIENFLINIPKSAEQEKIASFLGVVDTRLNQLRRKGEHLQTYKRGVMQQLFYQKIQFTQPDGSPFPPWEKKKLGDISDVRDGTHESPKYYATGKMLITSKNLMPDGSIDFKNVDFISELDYENINKRSKVSTGDILFGMIGTIGNPILLKSEGFAIKNVALIKDKKKLSNKFLIHYLKSHLIKKQFHEQNTGGTQKFIALGVIRLLEVLLPCIEEQEKIANFLTTIDCKIETLSRQIDQTEQFKKGLLQKLFV